MKANLKVRSLSASAVLMNTAIFCGATGCAAFQNRSDHVVSETRLDDDSRVVLSIECVTSAFEKKKTLRLQRIPGGDESLVTTCVTNDQENTYLLRIDSNKKRAWVVENPGKRVVLSADFAKGLKWTHRDQQPQWTQTGKE